MRKRPFKTLLDSLMNQFGYVPADRLISQIKLEGHVYVSELGRPETEIYLGPNVVTEKMRVNVAGLMARRAADWGFAVTYDSNEGYSTTVDSVFPTHIAVGTGTTAPATTQTTMDSPLLKAGSVAYYQLQRVLFHNDPALYPPNIPISASFYFDIPAGEVYDTYGTDVDYQEWALFGPNHPALLPSMSDPVPPGGNDMLARKVARLSKLSGLGLTARWEIRT